MSWLCVRGARGRSGGLGPVPGFVSSPFPPSRPAFPALCVAGRPVRVSLILARWYTIPCGLCVPQARSGCRSGIPRVPFVCVCARALAASAPPPPRVGVARAPRAFPVLGAGRADPRGPCPSACPASVPCSVWLAWGGGSPVRFPPTWLGAARSPWGGCGGGDLSPTPPRALLRAGLARYGGGTRVPGGGASCLAVGCPGSGALPPPTTRPFGRAAGAHYPLAVGAGVAGEGTRHHPHSARSCELALRTVGAARGRPGGAPLAWVWGVRGRALSHPQRLVLSGVRPGPTTHWLWVRGLQAWGPVTNPTARALASWLCALWGRHEGAWGGGAFCFGVQGWALSHPRQPVLWGVRPGGGASCLGVGRPGSGAFPPPTTHPFRRAARAHYPLAVGAGGAGMGTHHRPHSARPCELTLRAVGMA